MIYRHYATLYFVFVVDQSESELGILDLIQVSPVPITVNFKAFGGILNELIILVAQSTDSLIPPRRRSLSSRWIAVSKTSASWI